MCLTEPIDWRHFKPAVRLAMAKLTSPFEKRLGSNEVMWNMNECVCSCAFNGHGLVGRMRGFFKTPDAIEDWAEYFIEGETTFDYFEQFKDGNGDPLFTLENPPELADCTDPNLFNVSGQIVCGLVEPPIPSEDLPNCTGGS